MEASVETPRKLESEKAQRIVAAMRASVADRGAFASTFDHVAQEAGVSRGLLHYYFGSKERLLVEVVRHDCDLRMAVLEQSLAEVDSIDAIVDVLVSSLDSFIEDDDSGAALIFELWSASRHNDEIGEQMAELYRRVRDHVARVLDDKQTTGVVALRGSPQAVSSVLLALGDGVALQALSDPDWNSSEAIETGARTARFLLGASE